MPHLPGTAGLGRSRMEIGWLLLQVIIASTVFLNNGGQFDPNTTELPARTSFTARLPGEEEMRSQGESLAGLGIPASTSQS